MRHHIFENYKSLSTKELSNAFGCEFLVNVFHCAGGNYCPFPPGKMRLCCAYCHMINDCPDDDGVCVHFLEKDKKD